MTMITDGLLIVITRTIMTVVKTNNKNLIFNLVFPLILSGKYLPIFINVEQCGRVEQSSKIDGILLKYLLTRSAFSS